ncbi:LytTR family transcriptional regulator DNA-binding domain-containing protein [Paenibacillus odorifer]|nr:LytTR family transcriptional regulator DNA-binding domain-containing protein [Paenibacillus odorifer]
MQNNKKILEERMVFITVTENEDGDGIQQIDVEDILYIHFDYRLFISVHTRTTKYVTVGPLRFWESSFEKAGLNFMRLDRGVLANLDKIRVVDSEYKLAYFDSNIDNNTIRCTMSITGYKAFCDVYGINRKSDRAGEGKILKDLSWQTGP